MFQLDLVTSVSFASFSIKYNISHFSNNKTNFLQLMDTIILITLGQWRGEKCEPTEKESMTPNK